MNRTQATDKAYLRVSPARCEHRALPASEIPPAPPVDDYCSKFVTALDTFLRQKKIEKRSLSGKVILQSPGDCIIIAFEIKEVGERPEKRIYREREEGVR